MGTINYGRSDYITIGYNCNNIDYDDYEYSGEIIAELYETIQYILKDYRFYYFHVALKPGYYEGFYIDIEHNFSYCYDDYRDKIDAQKEITLIKKFLLTCVNDYELRAVYPGWCTSYADHNTTLKELDDAIKEMRDDVRITPTWATLPAGEQIAIF